MLPGILRQEKLQAVLVDELVNQGDVKRKRLVVVMSGEHTARPRFPPPRIDVTSPILSCVCVPVHVYKIEELIREQIGGFQEVHSENNASRSELVEPLQCLQVLPACMPPVPGPPIARVETLEFALQDYL